MTSLLQGVVDGSGMEQHGREYLIQVHKVFRERLDLQDLQVLKEQQVLKELLVPKVQLLHKVLKELRDLMVHRVHKEHKV